MRKLTAGRRRGALAALALGGFAVGLTEFVLMGLLPEVARGLLPGDWARSSSSAVAHAGWLITAYALGVVAGAPTIAAVGARVARKRLVAGLLVLFVVATALTALAPTFGLVLVARFVEVAGLPTSAVPWVLVAAGVGMTAGNLIGGMAADRGLRPAMLGGFAALILASAAYGALARWPAGLLAGAFGVGAAALFLAPALQIRLIEVAPGAS